MKEGGNNNLIYLLLISLFWWLYCYYIYDPNNHDMNKHILFHKNYKYLPFMDKNNTIEYSLSISINLIKRLIFGCKINISNWYIEIEFSFICIHIFISYIFNNKILKR
jgi:hypothetical protein